VNEHGLKKKVDRYLKALQQSGAPLWYVKISGGIFQKSGIPDYLLCVRGRFLYLELKSPDGSERQHMPQPNQIYCMRKMELSGATGVVLFDYDEFKHWIDEQLLINAT
jgi:hypothetical protein